MSELWRSRIRDGDTTTTGGRVEAKPQQWPVTYGDQHSAFEGDPVWYPALAHGWLSRGTQSLVAVSTLAHMTNKRV